MAKFEDDSLRSRVARLVRDRDVEGLTTTTDDLRSALPDDDPGEISWVARRLSHEGILHGIGLEFDGPILKRSVEYVLVNVGRESLVPDGELLPKIMVRFGCGPHGQPLLNGVTPDQLAEMNLALGITGEKHHGPA